MLKMQMISITLGSLLSERVEERTLGVLDVGGGNTECLNLSVGLGRYEI